MSEPFISGDKRTNDGLLPQSLEAEQALLGAVLADSECLTRVFEFIPRSNFFYKKAHQLIFQAFFELSEKNDNIDVITTSQHLKDKGELDDIGGRSYLSALTDHAPIAANAEYYAKIVKSKYLLRSLISTGNEIVSLGYQSEEDLDKLLDKAEQMVFGLAQSKIQDNLTHIGDIVQASWEILEQREANKGALLGMDTGFYDLNAITAGLQKSDLIILAARPAMGKCLQKDSEIVLADGSIATIEEIYKQKRADLLTLNPDWKLSITEASDFIDDGIKPIFKVRTRLGREIKTTITHPYLTINGWKKLEEVKVGDKIAIPRKIDVFGNSKIEDSRVKLLAYLIGDGYIGSASKVSFTNNNEAIQEDFITAVKDFDPALKVKHENYGGKRASSFLVSKDSEFLVEERESFALKLQSLLETRKISNAKLANHLEVSPSLITQWCSGSCAPNSQHYETLCQTLEVKSEDFLPKSLSSISKNSINSLSLWLKELNLLGKTSHDKFVPKIVFKLEAKQIALFLNRLFATDGWASVLSTGQAQIGYASSSKKLIGQVQHLLLRFGIIASICKKKVKYKDGYNYSWQLNITDQESISKFATVIGIKGKEEAVSKALEVVKNKESHSNKDLIPKEIWQRLQVVKGDESWSSLAKRAKLKNHTNIHVGKRALSRRRLLSLAEALGDKEAINLANSDIYWDEITSIEYLGEDQVYDLTIPNTHNFVANDICVHNTSLALNIGESVAVLNNKPVAVFSLEMSKEQLVQRLLCSNAQVDSNRIRTGQLYPEDWTRLGEAMSELGEAPLYIDDSAGLSVMDLRGKCRRLMAEKGDLGLVIVDYLQLMEGKSSDSRINQISEISRGLKMLARELNVPIMALSQLSRAVEARQDKKPMLSDLRESGSLEQDSDIVMFVYRDEYYNPESEKKGMAEVIIAKQRSGPVGTIELLFQSNITKFRNPVREG